MPLPIAISPCPNDTFTFHAWIHQLIPDAPDVAVEFADIQQLNQWAVEERYPVIKVSFGCLPKLLRHYRVLPVGAALGDNVGPKLLATKHFDLKDLSQKSVAVPGQETTAHQLLRLLAPEPRIKIFDTYDNMTDLILREQVDAAVVIHETRFCFEEQGLVEVADLGELWRRHYQAPVPLGCIAVHRDLGETVVDSITKSLTRSLRYAWKNPTASHQFVMEHAQEMDPEIARQHIALYVNQESECLSPAAVHGIERLLSLMDPSVPLEDWKVKALETGECIPC